MRTDDRAGPGRPIEITPYVLMGSASASGAGAAVRWPIGSRFGVELETEVKRAQITAMYVALSLVYDLPAIGRVTPYVAGGVGLERFAKAFYQPDGPPLLGSDTGLTVNAGGGRPRAGERSVGRPQRCAVALRLGPRRAGSVAHLQRRHARRRRQALSRRPLRHLNWTVRQSAGAFDAPVVESVYA